MQKLCSLCNINPPRKSGKREQSYCVECNKKYAKEHYHKNKNRFKNKWRNRNIDLVALIYERKNVPCKDCGKSYPHYVMDFDHVDPSNKSFTINEMKRRRMAFSEIEKEMNKCEVVCSNCHRERTHNRGYHDPTKH
jgi:hypothetical protein